MASKKHPRLLVESLEERTLLAAGALDLGFGGTGKVLTDFSTGAGEAAAVAVQPDGRILVAGFAFDPAKGRDDFALARYNADGSLDTTFGTGGKATTDLGSGAEARALALQGDGRIVVAGVVHDAASGKDLFALARYNPNGTLDPTFDAAGPTPGLITTAFPQGGAGARGGALQADGEIVAAGVVATTGTDTDTALARYTAAGTLDTGFGTAGRVVTDLGPGPDAADAVAVGAGGKILVAGYAADSAKNADDFALARYNTDGSLDTSWGGSGKVLTAFHSGDDRAHALALLGDGRVVAAGSATNDAGTAQEFALARYNAIGRLDTSFNGSGKVTNRFDPGGDTAYAVALQGDGRIVAAGSAGVGGGKTDFVLARYYPDGSLDRSWGGPGQVVTAFTSGPDAARGVAIQRDGRIVAAGFATPAAGNEEFALARYEADQVQFSKVSYQVGENAASALITVVRNGGVRGDVSVDVTTADGTARAGVDYVPVATTLTLHDGQASATFTVPILPDIFVDGNERLSLQLANPQGAALGGRIAATLTIRAAPRHPLTDVTGLVSVLLGRRRGPRRGRIRQKVTLVNHAARAIYGPFWLVLANLTRRINLRTRTGLTRALGPAGSPYVNLALGRLNPGQRVTITLVFGNPRGRRLRYTPRVFAGTGQL
jgi:uncharacterized delta-60 repeat protein